MMFTDVDSSIEGLKELIVGSKEMKKKMLTCLETLKSFAKQHSCVPHLNNFTEKNPCTSKKGHQIWNEKSISEALSR